MYTPWGHIGKAEKQLHSSGQPMEVNGEPHNLAALFPEKMFLGFLWIGRCVLPRSHTDGHLRDRSTAQAMV